MNIGERIKNRRNELNLSVDELASKIGKNRATIYRYENNEIENLPTTILEPLAKALQTTPAHLMGWEDEKPELEIIGQVTRSREYPYIPNPVAAGVPETIEGIESIPTISIPDYLLGKHAGNKDIIIMKVNGESMNRIIPNGAIIGVKTNCPITSLKDGDLVVFNHEYEYSVKHFYKSNEKLIFKPNSTEMCFTDVVFDKEENVNIVGKVIMYSVIMD